MSSSLSSAPPARAPGSDPRREPHRWAGPVVLLISALAIWLGFAASAPPALVPASAPAGEYSGERAQRHLYAITRAPRAVGSAEHAVVRDYLANELEALGLETQVQTTLGHQVGGGLPRAATVHNVVARRAGTGGAGAVLLMAHYDAVPGSYGAGDNGAAVAAIMETLRALQEGPPLRNDVIVLFSDAEEVGLLGAEAFVAEHPWMETVSVVLNFEGRGAGGAAMLFQTSPDNAALIREFAAAARYPVATSLAYEVYRRMPNDTDLSVFLRAGRPIPALNFAFVGAHTHYHTPLDRYEELDPRSLQHHGEYALALTRHFGDLDPARLRADGDRVYFNAPALGTVHYPYGWALPLALLCALWLAGLIGFGLRRGALRWAGLGLGLALGMLALVAAPLVAHLGWGATRALHPEYGWILQGDTYNSAYYLVGFSAVAVAIFVALLVAFRRRAAARELAVGPLALVAVATLAVSATAPGASYILVWPLVFALAALSLELLRDRPGLGHAVALALLGVPALVMLPPLIRMLQETMTMAMLAGCIAVLVVLLGLLTPQLDSVGRHWRWALPMVLLVGLGALLGGTLTSAPTEARRHPNSIFYLLDADAQRALWVSLDPEPDAWTRQFLGDAPARGPLDEYRLTSARMPRALQAPAPLLPRTAPALELLEETPVPQGRRLRLRVSSAVGAERLALLLDDAGVRVADVVLDGRPLTGYRMGGRGVVIVYFAPPADGFEIALTLDTEAPVRLRVAETADGLPERPGGGFAPRPPHMMGKPFVTTDAAVVHRVIRM